MDISTLANLINAIAVTAGVIFAAVQINHYRRRRRRDAMLNLVQSFQGPTFARGLRRIIELPDGASADEIRKTLGADGEDLVVHVTATWETIGVLLFHGELSIEIIDDFFSGPILISSILGLSMRDARKLYCLPRCQTVANPSCTFLLGY